MFNVLQTYLERTAPLSEADIAVIRAVFVPKKLKKGEFFLREGEMTRYGAFVASGFLRSYVIDGKGKEHIVQFAPEQWWITDKSFTTAGATATFFIDAIEDSEVLMIDLPGHMQLMEHVSAYAASFLAGLQKRTIAKDKRIVDALTASAEERYRDFLETYPTIAQRVPQHMLASYLGIAPETLSRIRGKVVRKK